MRYNTNKKTFRLFALATVFIVMALVSACGGKTDRADDTDTVRLKRLSQIDSSIVKRVPNMETIVHQGMKNAKDSSPITNIISDLPVSTGSPRSRKEWTPACAASRLSASARCRRRKASGICHVLTRSLPAHTTALQLSTITSIVTVR